MPAALAAQTKFKTVNMREEGPGAGQHREDGDRAMNVLMKCQETPHFTLEAGNWNVIISQSSETITRDHHHRDERGKCGSSGTIRTLLCYKVYIGHSGNIPSDLVQIGRGQGNFVDVRIFPAVSQFLFVYETFLCDPKNRPVLS